MGSVEGVRHVSKVPCQIEVDYVPRGAVLLRVIHDGERTVITAEMTKGDAEQLRTLLMQAEAHI